MIRALVVIGLFLGAGPAHAQAGLPEAFFGQWQGTSVAASAGNDLEITAEDLNVLIEPDGDGFRMRWTALSHEGTKRELFRQPVEARFEPTDRPGVFAYEPEAGSLLSGLFGDPSTSNPLEGEPLLWARFADGALSVYGLAINDQGGFDLYQHVRTLTDQGMSVRQTHRTEHDPVVVIEGQLQRTGG